MDIIQAVATKLRADPVILSMLPSGQNGVILAGTLMTGRVPEAVQLPCIAIQDMGDGGGVNDLPLVTTSINLRIYDVATPNGFSYVNINRLMRECQRLLHRTPLDVDMSYQLFFELYYDNYKSPESFDDFVKLPFRVIRFRSYSATTFYDPRGYI